MAKLIGAYRSVYVHKTDHRVPKSMFQRKASQKTGELWVVSLV